MKAHLLSPVTVVLSRWEYLTPPRLDTSPLLVNSQHMTASNFSLVDYKTITMAVDELLCLGTQHATSTTTLWLEQVTFSEVRLHYKSRSPLCLLKIRTTDIWLLESLNRNYNLVSIIILMKNNDSNHALSKQGLCTNYKKYRTQILHTNHKNLLFQVCSDNKGPALFHIINGQSNCSSIHLSVHLSAKHLSWAYFSPSFKVLPLIYLWVKIVQWPWTKF